MSAARLSSGVAADLESPRRRHGARTGRLIEPSPSVLRRLLVVLLVVHAAGHLSGTDTALRAAREQLTTPFVTTGEPFVDLLLGYWRVEDQRALLLLAICWTAVMVAFLMSASWMWHERRGWQGRLVQVTLASVVLCVLALPQSWIGLVIDLTLLVALLVIGTAARPGERRQAFSTNGWTIAVRQVDGSGLAKGSE